MSENSLKFQKKMNELYDSLQKANINEFVSKKNVGTNKLDYLSWGAAVDYMTKCCHELNMDWTYDHELIEMADIGYKVKTIITVTDAETELSCSKVMYLHAYNHSNQAIKIGSADAAQINKTEMRCLVKCMTLFGLGLSLYMKDFSELDDVKTGKQVVEEKNSADVEKARKFIKDLLDVLPAETDTTKYDNYTEINDVVALRAMYKEIKNTFFGGINENN